MALCGLIVLILSIGYPKKLLFDAQMKSQDLNAEIVKYKIRHEYLTKKIDKTLEQKDKYSSVNLTDIDKEFLDHQLLLEDVDHSAKKLETLNNQMHEIEKYGDWGFWLGGLISIFGFLMWYAKVQRPTDKKIKADSASIPSPTPPDQPQSPA